MARTQLSYSPLTGNGAAAASPTSVDVANGMSLIGTGGWNGGAQPERTILIVSNTDTSARVITIKAGTPLLGAGAFPDNALSIPASSTRYLGPFESARIMQADGTVSIDFASGFTGTITALLFPRGI